MKYEAHAYGTEFNLKLETFSKIEMKRIEIHFDFKMK